VHGIEAQPVQMEFLDPVQRVVDNELADRGAAGAIVVDGVAQGVLCRSVNSCGT
jgi:hypothetical protein